MKGTSNGLTSTLSLNPILEGAVPYTAVDPAGGRETLTKGDMSVIVTGFARRVEKTIRLYVVEALGGRWKSVELIDNIFRVSNRWRSRQIVIEENVGKGYLMESVRMHAQSVAVYLPIEWVTASLHGTGKKVQRIEALHEPYKYHQIWHAEELKGSEFERQVLYWTPEGKGLDDFPDCLAMLWLFVNRQYGGMRGGIREVSRPRAEPIYQTTQV